MLRDFTKEAYDIILQGGQSNSEGCGHGAVDDPYMPDERVQYLTRDFAVSMAEERVWKNHPCADFSLYFARKYIRDGLLAEGRKLLIVRAARGGSGFTARQWGLEDEFYLNMIEMNRTALALNPDNRLTAFLWHQGESDWGAGYETHHGNLTALLQDVRSRFNAPELPFIAADFCQDSALEHPERSLPISSAVRAVCGEAGFAQFVETDGLSSNSKAVEDEPWDKVHFSRASLCELGNRYYTAFKDIIGGKVYV